MSATVNKDGVVLRASLGDALARWIGRHPVVALIGAAAIIFVLWLILAPWPAGFEDVFGRKRLFINALNQSDLALLMGYLLLVAFLVVFSNLLADVVYAWLDPRVKYD